MKDLWEYRRQSHKKVDFEDKTYNKIQDLCFELFGPHEVVPCLEHYCIYIIDCHVRLTLHFSGNETKVYVDTYVDINRLQCTYLDWCVENKVKVNPKVSQFFWDNKPIFRVFDYEEMEKYLRFKLQEIELIKSIEG